MDAKEIIVNLGERSYPVLVGSGCVNEVASYVRPTVKKVARLGLSRAALTGLSRLGIGGFAASLGIQGLGLLDD